LANHLARSLIGDLVENEDGQALGRVVNLALDTENGRVVYVVISSGSFLGIGRRLVPVPAGALSSATTKARTLAMAMSEDRWKAAPSLRSMGSTALSDDQELAAAIARFYHELEPSQPGGANLAPTGDWPDGNHPRDPDSRALRWATALTGEEVVSRRGESLGKTRDLLVDLSGRKENYVILATHKLSGGAGLFAVPFRRLHFTPGKLVMDGNQTLFERARWLDAREWEEHRAPVDEIYRIQDVKPTA